MAHVCSLLPLAWDEWEQRAAWAHRFVAIIQLQTASQKARLAEHNLSGSALKAGSSQWKEANIRGKPKTGLPEIAESGGAPLPHAASPASLHLCGFLFLPITKHSHFTEFLQRYFSFHSFLPKIFLSNSVTLPYPSWKDTIYDSIFEYLLKHVYCPKLKRNRLITPQVGLLSFLWCCSHEKSHLEEDLEKVCSTSYFFFIFKSQSY